MGSSVLLLMLQLLLATDLVSSQRLRKIFGCDCSDGKRSQRLQRQANEEGDQEWDEHPHTSHAVCHMQPNNNSSISGNVYFRSQSGDGIEILLDLRGFPNTEQSHGIQVRKFGDLTGGCETLGDLYIPHNRWNGNHQGDLGHFRPNSNGVIHQTISQVRLRLHGDDSIIGRSIVVYREVDDLDEENPGSAQRDDAGHWLACCVIGISSAGAWPQE